MVALREASAERTPHVLFPGAGVRGPRLLDTWRAPGGHVATAPQPVAIRLSDVLGGWRAAERALGEHRGASREVAVLEAEIGAWRAAYQRIFAELRARYDALGAADLSRWPF